MSSQKRRRPSRRRRRNRTQRALLAVAVVLAGALAVTLVRRSRAAGKDTALPGWGVELPAYVEQDLLPANDYSRPGTPLESIRGVVIHYVGNPAATAHANRDYFASLASGREETYASSHFVVGLEGEVVQCIPLTEIAYASKERNADTVAIEVCHPDAEGQFSPVTYERCVELTAWLCRTFDLDPEQDVIRHYDVTGKLCPLYYVEHPEAWDALRADVAAEMARQAEAERAS